jgi:hypothetical protein
MVNRVKTYIKQGPSDEEAEAFERIGNRAAWLVILLSALYFGPICLKVFLR